LIGSVIGTETTCAPTIAGEARGILDLDRAREVEHLADRRFALARDLVGGPGVAEAVDDVGLPFDRLVARVGGIQERFLVAEVGVFLAQRVERFRRRIRRHRLRQELLRELVLDEGLHLLHRVAAHGERRLHHEAGIAEHLVLRVSLQQLVRHVRGYRHARGEHQREHDVELQSQSHLLSPERRWHNRRYAPNSPPDSPDL
jgi:hypothetical protein